MIKEQLEKLQLNRTSLHLRLRLTLICNALETRLRQLCNEEAAVKMHSSQHAIVQVDLTYLGL